VLEPGKDVLKEVKKNKSTNLNKRINSNLLESPHDSQGSLHHYFLAASLLPWDV
jgi:hypothetical protein